MPSRLSKIWIACVTFVAIMACVPSFASQQSGPPVIDQNEINKIIEQTANAASTQTALAKPIEKSTKTARPTATGTMTETPTPTETLIFIYNTPTVFVLPPATVGFTPTSDKDYACKILSAPQNGEYYNPRVKFNVRWRFQNVGRQMWQKFVTQFIYDSGDRFHLVSGYGLKRDTFIGDVGEFIVEMQAPRDVGTYTTFWTMKYDTQKFCRVSLKINVVPLQ